MVSTFVLSQFFIVKLLTKPILLRKVRIKRIVLDLHDVIADYVIADSNWRWQKFLSKHVTNLEVLSFSLKYWSIKKITKTKIQLNLY